VLAVFGGSMGCETLNDAMAHAVTDMLNKDEHLWVVWQTGRGGYEGEFCFVLFPVWAIRLTTCFVHRRQE
jgi:hypothetical protein